MVGSYRLRDVIQSKSPWRGDTAAPGFGIWAFCCRHVASARVLGRFSAGGGKSTPGKRVVPERRFCFGLESEVFSVCGGIRSYRLGEACPATLSSEVLATSGCWCTIGSVRSQKPCKTIQNGTNTCPKAFQNVSFGVFGAMMDKYLENVPNKIVHAIIFDPQIDAFGLQNRCWRMHVYRSFFGPRFG